ncbi:MAG: chemotaxis protein CheW [Spirochaetota bacterium]
MEESLTNQYLTFALDSERYALNVTQVREVLEVATIHRLPHMPDYVRGVTNVRGKVLPVVDLRLKFGMDEREDTVDTAIIVADVGVGADAITVGCRADAVDQVIDIPAESIEPPPRLGTRVNGEFIQGIGKVDETFVVILRLDKVFGDGELSAVTAQAETTAAGV